MIQDISPYRYYNEYQNRQPAAEDLVFIFKGRSALCRENADGTTSFPKYEEVQSAGLTAEGTCLHYLFRIDDYCCFLLLTDRPDEPEPDLPGYSYITLMEMRSEENVTPAFAALTAFHLYTWYDKNRFCGRCGGGRLVHETIERMLKCPACGNMVFPTIAPAVIVGVTWGEKLLMTKYAGREYGGWALIAGFCEVGETVEDTVHREVMEEAGVHVSNLRYIDSQPWGSDSNLLMGYFCDVDGDPAIHMDAEELSRAQWVDRSEIPDMSDNISLTGHLIELFRKGKEK